MANIKFRAIGKNNPVNLNVRFYHNKIDCSTKSNIFVLQEHWSNKTFKIKQNVDDKIKLDISKKINDLSNLIIEQFFIDFPKGNKIDSNWLTLLVNKFNDKPIAGVDISIYFVDFLDNYIENSKTRVNPKTGQIISPRTIQNYTTTLRRLQEFEIFISDRIRTKEINLDFHNKFTSFLKVEGKYSNTLIEKYISQIKGFVKEARIAGFETSPEIESKKFTFKRDEVLSTYLNLNEINTLFNLDLKDYEHLKDSRDLLIIGVWTGLRISDLKRINSFNITENRIQILETEKNKAFVEIPIHPQLKEILLKRGGVFPEVKEYEFNKQIKTICKIAKIEDVIIGSKKDPDTNRKVKDYYKKHELITTHTCRRSFVSNHYGKIDDKTIMAITTHKSYNEYIKYVKTTMSEHAQNFEDYWNK
jgi:integrase